MKNYLPFYLLLIIPFACNQDREETRKGLLGRTEQLCGRSGWESLEIAHSPFLELNEKGFIKS